MFTWFHRVPHHRRHFKNYCPTSVKTRKAQEAPMSTCQFITMLRRLAIKTYCAMCHNVDVLSNNVTAWSATYNEICIKEPFGFNREEIYQTYRKCGYIFSTEYIKICPHHSIFQYPIIQHCPTNASAESHRLCKYSPMSLRLHQDKNYRNEHCARCNGFNSASHECSKTDPGNVVGNTPANLASLFDFSSSILSKARTFYLQNNQSDSGTKSPNRTDTSTSVTVAFYVSVVSISISNVLIVLFIAFVGATHELKNKNVKTLVMLASCIFVSNLIYVVSALQFHYEFRYFQWLCKLIAVMFYCVNISTFVWSLAIAVDIHNMLITSISLKQNNLESPLSFRNLLIGCTCLSFLIATLAFGVDMGFPDSSWAPKFGVGTCWINSVLGHIVFYFAPVAVSLVFNIGECHDTVQKNVWWHFVQLQLTNFCRDIYFVDCSSQHGCKKCDSGPVEQTTIRVTPHHNKNRYYYGRAKHSGSL